MIRRILATGCCMLVFALGLYAASPTLHQQLHDGSAAIGDDGCAVVLFATGVSVPLVAVAPAPPAAKWQQLRREISSELLLDSPRYLLRPERGPPVS